MSTAIADDLRLPSNQIKKMSEQRLSLWNAEEDLEEVVDLSLAIGNYGPNVYDDGLPALSFIFSHLEKKIPVHIQQPQIDESTLIAMQQHIAQQAAFSQIPDVVKSVRGLSFRCVALGLNFFLSSSSIFIKRCWSTTCLKSRWRMRVVGTSILKSIIRGRSGQRRS